MRSVCKTISKQRAALLDKELKKEINIKILGRGLIN